MQKLNAMKKLTLLVAALVLAFSAGAQELEWGVHAGLNLAKERVKADGGSASTDSHAQFQVGFTVAAPLMQSAPLYLQTGLDFTGRGGESGNASDNLYYLQLPVTVSWHFDVGRIVSIRPEVGVYYALGLFSNTKQDGEALKDDDGDNFSLFGEYDGEQAFKRSDFGLRFGVDVALKKHYSIGLGYDLGLLNINKDMFDSSVKVRNGVFYIRAGYNF